MQLILCGFSVVGSSVRVRVRTYKGVRVRVRMYEGLRGV